jgi:hypothetical protein
VIRLNLIRFQGFALSQLNPLTQLTRPEIRDKPNTVWDKEFTLLWLNLVYPSRNPLHDLIPDKVFALTRR